MKKSLLTLVTILLLTASSFAQVAINTTGDNPNASAILDISSTDKGLLIPRMSTDNRTNDVIPVEGLLVYDIDTDSFWYYDSSETEWIEVKAGEALSINALSDGRTTDGGIFIGKDAGLNDQWFTYSTAIGYEALKTNTTGSENVAFGFKALTNSSGNYNSAFGYESSKYNTSGDDNVAIGKSAMLYNSTGNNNTAVGSLAGVGSLWHNISGCVFLGYKAGINNNSDNKLFITNTDDSTPLIGGDFNTDQVDINGTIKITGGTPGADKVLTSDADGLATWETKSYGATELNGLSDAITQVTNLFIGDQVGTNNNSGLNYNTAIGFEAFKTNISGGSNTILGYKAALHNSSGYRNVAIGLQSIYYNVTGGKNTAIGYRAGSGSSGSSINGCVFLGNEAGYTNTSDNKLFITNSDDTTPLIGGDFSTDQVDINGTIKITGGTPGADKVLTSDADGLASWETKTYGATELNGLSDAITDGFSIFIGDQVGTNDDGTNYNTVMGDEAFKTNTSGNYNTAFGYKTLEVSNGASNSAFGQNALRNNSTGSENTAIGRETLYYNQTGSYNTAVGYQAGLGHSGISMDGCVYLGYQAGKNNTSSNNLFIDNSSTSTPLIGGSFYADRVDINGTIKITGGTPGADKVLTSDADGLASWETKTYGATELNGLSDAITDGSSIFIGDQAGTNDDGTNYNTAVGISALKANTSGKNNTATGFESLSSNTSGLYNTAIGTGAFFYNQTGSNNTAVGYEAGMGSPVNNISGGVFIGYQAGKTNTSNNKLFIDNSSTTSPLIGGDFSSDELYLNADVGIGTTSPNEQFEIAGASGASARMIVSDGLGSNRYTLLFVSPSATDDFARIDAYKYGTGSGGKVLKINTAGTGGNVIIGGNVLPKTHKVEDLGESGTAWDNVYADDYITEGSAAFSNVIVTKQLINFPPMEKKAGAFDEFTDKGLKELDPASLPKELTEDNALLIDEMTTYNYKANYEQQQQIETLKNENTELKARLEKLEILMESLK